MCREYNGWKNWETWNCNLSFGDIFCDMAQDIFDNLDYSILYEQGKEQLKNKFCNQLSDAMECAVNDMADEFIDKRYDSFFSSVILTSIKTIDFYDIASTIWETIDQSKLDEYRQEQEQE